MRRPALTLAVAAVLACAGPRAAERPSPLLGRPLEFGARRLDGREVRLPVAGARATVVDLWATWCEPCRDQLPELDRLAAAWGADGVQVYAISFDEDRAALEEFVARYRVDVPVLWEKGGGTLANRLALTRLPTTILLDGAGVVRAVHLGFDPGQPSELETELRRALGR